MIFFDTNYLSYTLIRVILMMYTRLFVHNEFSNRKRIAIKASKNQSVRRSRGAAARLRERAATA